ncbi:BtrH N-terminal domain-containing protein [Acidihalobacter ferrooxydans]|uniref:Peptidase n=1 Tax=Acidihalobacter ferrooxydans TaxID=1765967 RepID=A0A1P8UE36_9GAMM|nr:BtrH N-terminal domain-containing protein [Acidihalobacter ferrooxydans]APZ42048.1 peptidase [Acidihalobacter ferrooxydans]
MQVEGYQHRHAGHCESGVMSALLSHQGLELSEPLAFGLSSALVFAHFPFVRVGGVPLTSYRMPPGHIIKGLERSLGVRITRRRYRDPARGMRELDELLDAGRPVGLQTSVYWLPYFPPDMRFHFNAHNLIIFGREGDDYLVSDPVVEHPQRIARADLEKARFVRGPFAPRGLIYFPTDVPQSVDLTHAVPRAIRRTLNINTRLPLPVVGLPAIRRMAKTLREMPRRHPDPRYQRLYVGSIVRMQEEIGTGGGGFRFIQGAFLQQAGHALGDERLHAAAEAMIAAGDQWRQFALRGARLVKAKQPTAQGFAELADELLACAEVERKAFEALRSTL